MAWQGMARHGKFLERTTKLFNLKSFKGEIAMQIDTDEIVGYYDEDNQLIW